MAVQLFDADEAFVDRMIALAGRWEVQFLPGRAEGVDDWWLELGERPGCMDDGSPDAVCAHAGCGAGSHVLHPFAYFADPDDPAEWDDESGPWHSRPDVRREAALLRDRLGEPETAGPWPYEDVDATRHVRWSRGEAYVILLDGNDAMSHGAYRRAGVAVRPKR